MRRTTSLPPIRQTPTHIAMTAAAMAMCVLAGGLATLMPISTALAQPETVQSLTPYLAVVTKDGIGLQCRAGSTAYSVKLLTSGQILKVDGQADNYLRVEYPAGLSAFVKVDEATQLEPGKTLKLTKNSQLTASDVAGTVNWWRLLDKELPAGTTFAITKVVKGADGKDAGYLVPAPKGSHGFVRKDALRQATQAEIDASANTPVTPTITKPIPVGPTPLPVKPAVPDTTKPKPPPIVPPVTDPNATKPVDPNATKPVDPNAVKPIDPAVKPIEGDPTKPPEVVPQPEPKKVIPEKPKVDAEALNTLYTNAMTKSEGEVEIGAVIAEFQKALDGIEEKPDTERLRRQLSLRLDALKLRSQLSESLRQSEQRSAELKQQSQKVSEQVADLERKRHFAVVGRLLASSVYDGKKLPLMYRIASSDPSSPRTLAYVIPTETILLADNLGKTVGIAGDKKFDDGLKVNVITPTRLEVVTVKAIEPVVPLPTPPTTPPGTILNDQDTKIVIPVKPPAK